MEILKDCKNSNEQIKQRDAQIIELQRKYQDTNRAYQQEKLERENKDRRIQQLEKSDKVCHVSYIVLYYYVVILITNFSLTYVLANVKFSHTVHWNYLSLALIG